MYFLLCSLQNHIYLPIRYAGIIDHSARFVNRKTENNFPICRCRSDFENLPLKKLLSVTAYNRTRGMFVNDVRPKRRKNNQVQRIVKRPAGVEREGRSEAEERPNEAHRAARRGEIIAR